MDRQIHDVTDEEADELIELLTTKRGTTLLHLDYVKGRSVKLSVYRRVPGVVSQDGLPERYLEFPWYDHHAHQERALLEEIGVKRMIRPKPPYIENGWKTYREDVVPAQANSFQVAETRQAFFTGASTTWKTLILLMRPWRSGGARRREAVDGRERGVERVRRGDAHGAARFGQGHHRGGMAGLPENVPARQSAPGPRG